MKRYLAVFEKIGETFSVFIPDIPTIAATGRDRDEAYHHIVTALSAYAQGVGVDRLPEPQAFTLEIEWGEFR